MAFIRSEKEFQVPKRRVNRGNKESLKGEERFDPRLLDLP
jgi:hypothetical protein